MSKDFSQEIRDLIGQQENEYLEYKAVLPPSRSLAQLICAFANTSGGYIILGVAETTTGIIVNGLSEDFRVSSILHKAADLLTPRPNLAYNHVDYGLKSVYAIKVEHSVIPVLLEGKEYIRQGTKVSVRNEQKIELKQKSIPLVVEALEDVSAFRIGGTGAKSKYFDHYQGLLNMVGDLGHLLYPNGIEIITNSAEGKILGRMLFSSSADSFEIYLTDLLYEIFLAKPETLKGKEQISVKEVLDCSDMQEFIAFYAKKRLSKLQRGSVKGFIEENTQIGELQVITVDIQDKIEKLLQIRHLYAHRNGVVDEKFISKVGNSFPLNHEHQLAVIELIEHVKYFASIVDLLDKAAVRKFRLATVY